VTGNTGTGLADALAEWRALSDDQRTNVRMVLIRERDEGPPDLREACEAARFLLACAAAEPEAKDEVPPERLQYIHDRWGGALAKMAEGPRCTVCEDLQKLAGPCTPSGCVCPCHVGGAP
jgi:hypothetical protein